MQKWGEVAGRILLLSWQEAVQRRLSRHSLVSIHSNEMSIIDILPVEIQTKILAYLGNDAFSMNRVESVCTLWANIVNLLERRGISIRTRKVHQLAS